MISKSKYTHITTYSCGKKQPV